MGNYRFTLEPYSGKSTRYRCPTCEKNNTFTRYVDIEKAEYVNPVVGICNRSIKCGYHYTPKMYFEDNKNTTTQVKQDISKIGSPLTARVTNFVGASNCNPSYIPRELLQKSLIAKRNNFLRFISAIYNEDVAMYVKGLYHIGSSTRWPGATIFWQIDQEQNIRTGKLMQYNPKTGKRIAVNWVHAFLELKPYELNQCLFGLHLLNREKSKTIAIVESEKTAIIASVAFPEFVWMATGGLNNLKASTTEQLKNRHVVLFPDAGCYDLWKAKIAQLPKNIYFEISNLLETHTSSQEKSEGYDLADYVIQIMMQQ